MDVLNTHSYDGKLDPTVMEKLNQLNVCNYTAEEKQAKAHELQEQLKTLHPKAQYFLTLIIQRMNTPDNYDPANKINTDDLIYVCWMLRNNPDFIQLLEYQLMEMESGFCVQGRVNRLFQIISPFVQFIET